MRHLEFTICICDNHAFSHLSGKINGKISKSLKILWSTLYGKCSFRFNALINNSKCEKQSYCDWKTIFFLNLQPRPNFNTKFKHSWKVWKSSYQEMQILPLFHNSVALVFNPLSANPTKWSNTLKQFVGYLPTNRLSVFDHFVKLAVKVLIKILWVKKNCQKIQVWTVLGRVKNVFPERIMDKIFETNSRFQAK